VPKSVSSVDASPFVLTAAKTTAEYVALKSNGQVQCQLGTFHGQFQNMRFGKFPETKLDIVVATTALEYAIWNSEDDSRGLDVLTQLVGATNPCTTRTVIVDYATAELACNLAAHQSDQSSRHIRTILDDAFRSHGFVTAMSRINETVTPIWRASR
jgi:hypothetical protein